MYPSTIQEAQKLGFKHYFTKKPCKNGHVDLRYLSSKECVACRRIKNQNPELIAKQKQWAINNKDLISLKYKQKYQSNIEKERERSRRKWFLNPEKVKATNLKWAKNNPNKFRTIIRNKNAKRRLVVKQQMPKWANQEKIKEIYMNKPDGYHVDHIIPLRGKLVSGLHVENNLQYLTHIENSKKRNKFIGA